MKEWIEKTLDEIADEMNITKVSLKELLILDGLKKIGAIE